MVDNVYLLVISLDWPFKYHDRMMQTCSMLTNVVMIYEEKRENDWRQCTTIYGH
jgi:hypothetical protein